MSKTSFIKLIFVDKVCVSCFNKLFNFFLFLVNGPQILSVKSGYFECILDKFITSSKNLFTICSLFCFNGIASKAKHHQAMDFYSVVL